MLGESALCLAYDPLTSPAGVTTPSVAMGQALLDRLRAAGSRSTWRSLADVVALARTRASAARGCAVRRWSLARALTRTLCSRDRRASSLARDTRKVTKETASPAQAQQSLLPGELLDPSKVTKETASPTIARGVSFSRVVSASRHARVLSPESRSPGSSTCRATGRCCSRAIIPTR